MPLFSKPVMVIVLLWFGTIASSFAATPADPKVLHVLNRLSFGARPGDVQKVAQMGVDCYIQQQLSPDGGTDHGHGNVMWVMGGKVKGGKVYGKWDGLERDRLYQGRDVPIITDFRDVIHPVLERHLSLNHAQLAKVFPSYTSWQSVSIV